MFSRVLCQPSVRRMLSYMLLLLAGLPIHAASAADFTIGGISDAAVEEFTAYTSPFPDFQPVAGGNGISGNLTWSLVTDPLSTDYATLKELPFFNNMGSDLAIGLWITFNITTVAAPFSVDPVTGRVSLPPQTYQDSGNNTYHVILMATDNAGSKAALHWKVDITEKAGVSLELYGISNSTLLEKSAYQSATPYIVGSPLGDVTYSLAGADAAQFSVESSSGVVSMLPKNYTPASDANADNIYEITLVATDEADNQAMLSWTITLEELPAGHTFTLTGISDEQVYENNDYTSATPVISGKHNKPVSFVLQGEDAQFFTVNSSTGVVSLTEPLDFENPVDFTSDNQYQLTLVATDNAGDTASLSWTVSIIDLPARNFSITAKNDQIQEGNAYTSTAPAINGSYWPTLVYSIAGQENCSDPAYVATDDACLFTIDASTGIVSMTAKAHATPEDINADNIYQITVQATDREDTTQSVIWTVRVTFSLIKDSDGDGVYDTYELAEGTDPFNASDYQYVYNFGTPDATSIDADADGISNIDESNGLEPYGDNNNDGLPNYLDPFDRGDGQAALCTIKIISNYPDLDGNPSNKAVCDTQYGLDPDYDRDQDGLANFRDNDSDGDAIPDVIEGGMYRPDNTSGIPLDSDSDGIPDYLDSDSDGDGIPDIMENHSFSHISNPENIADVFHVSKGTGVSTLFNGTFIAQNFSEQRLQQAILNNQWLANFDGDGLPNYRDTDSDDDGIPDILEGTVSGSDLYASVITRPALTDSNSNHIADIFDVAFTLGEDTNSSGIDDRFDAAITGGDDANSNGIDDRYETVAAQALRINSSLSFIDRIALAPKTSGIGNPDFLKLDSDHDCISDSVEVGSTGIMITDTASNTISLGIDSAFTACFDEIDVNGEPRLQFKDYSCLLDSDGDGVPDFRDLDSDNDGLMDVDEARTTTLDIDRDGMCDNPSAAGALISDAASLLDSDGDNTPDYLDLTSDGATQDVTFVDPALNPADYDANGRILPTADADIDGIDDIVDTDPANFGMLPIDCEDPANDENPACVETPPVDCDAEPEHPDCYTPPEYCDNPDNADLPECQETPDYCDLDPNLPECMPPEPPNCNVDFSHPLCLDPNTNPQNGKIKTNERGSAGMALLTMMLAVWFVRRRITA